MLLILVRALLRSIAEKVINAELSRYGICLFLIPFDSEHTIWMA